MAKEIQRHCDAEKGQNKTEQKEKNTTILCHRRKLANQAIVQVPIS